MKPLYVSLRPFVDHHALSRPADWAGIFSNNNPLEVEIGCGNGEFLARYCQEQTSVNFIGFEEYCERVSRCLRKLNLCKASNARVLRMDVRPAFKYLFTQQSIQYVHCLFPPPWPKKSDIKHRLFQPEFLRLVNNRLCPSGGLKIVTDHKPYALWITEQVLGTGFTFEAKTIPASYGTKFEKKWSEGGQNEFYELLFIKKDHIHVPPEKENILEHYIIPSFDPDVFTMAEYSQDQVAVVLKDYLYDPKRQTAMLTLLVHDDHVLQCVRVVIFKNEQGWRVNLAQGSMLMPTPGIAKTLELVRDAAFKKQN